nr:MAG TPA: hypothetical protein [Caudoviricetes sp.]
MYFCNSKNFVFTRPIYHHNLFNLNYLVWTS